MTQRLLVLLAAFAGLSAFAGQEPQRGPGGLFAGFAIFGALDTDHDNALTAPEIDNAAAVLKQMDRNGDGRVAPDEFPAGRGGREGRGREGGRGGSGVGDEPPAAPPTPDELATMLMTYDANKNGALEKSEVPTRLQGLFARGDENGDGSLTPDEIRKAAAAQPPPAGRGRGERGREGGGRGGPPRRDALFTALDRDGDGTLSADEISGAPAALRQLDANGDGTLTIEEVFPGGRGRG